MLKKMANMSVKMLINVYDYKEKNMYVYLLSQSAKSLKGNTGGGSFC